MDWEYLGSDADLPPRDLPPRAATPPNRIPTPDPYSLDPAALSAAELAPTPAGGEGGERANYAERLGRPAAASNAASAAPHSAAAVCGASRSWASAALGSDGAHGNGAAAAPAAISEEGSLLDTSPLPTLPPPHRHALPAASYASSLPPPPLTFPAMQAAPIPPRGIPSPPPPPPPPPEAPRVSTVNVSAIHSAIHSADAIGSDLFAVLGGNPSDPVLGSHAFGGNSSRRMSAEDLVSVLQCPPLPDLTPLILSHPPDPPPPMIPT